MVTYTERLDREEDRVIQWFKERPIVTQMKQHPLEGIEGLSNEVFERVLLQRRVFSLRFFEPFYNTALCGVVDDELKEVIRGIIQEEYPTGMQNHREDVVQDLEAIGIPKEQILTTQPSLETLLMVRNMLELVAYNSSDMYEVQAITAMRVAGEVLPGEELDIICDELEARYGLTRDESVFYAPHATHDRKTGQLGMVDASHSDRFGPLLVEKVQSEGAFRTAVDIMHKAGNIRAGFYCQF